jgi:Protein of unknown function (DUF2379)
VYGTVDALRGRWDNAEARLQQVLSSTGGLGYFSAAGSARLAELRISQGRYEEAAALIAPFEHDHNATPTLARLRLAQGRYDEAAVLLRSLVRSYGSDSIRLAPSLALLVDVELRRAAIQSAERASQRLLELEERCGCNDIRALARLSAARIALHRDDASTALEELDTALTLLIHIDRPLLTAQVRIELARALAKAGDLGSARAEAEAALAAFEARGAVPDVVAGKELLGDLDGQTPPPASGDDAGLRSPVGGAAALTAREREASQPGDRNASLPLRAHCRDARRSRSRQARFPQPVATHCLHSRPRAPRLTTGSAELEAIIGALTGEHDRPERQEVPSA